MAPLFCFSKMIGGRNVFPEQSSGFIPSFGKQNDGGEQRPE